mgnify:FL=1
MFLSSFALQQIPPLPVAGVPMNDKATLSNRLFIQQVKKRKLEHERQSQAIEHKHQDTCCSKCTNTLRVWWMTPSPPPKPPPKPSPPIDETSSSYFVVKDMCKRTVTADWYQWAMLGLIMLNTTLLAVDHYPMSSGMEKTLDECGIPFTIIFTVEVLVKIWCMGYYDWKRGSFNQFDAVVVFLDILGYLSVAIAFSGGAALDSVTVLRTLRLLRVFKLVEFWEEFKKSINTVLRSIDDVFNFTVVLILVIFVAALLGMGIFGGRYAESGFDVIPRGNFNSISWALMTVFQVITGENWNEVMLAHMEIDILYSVVFFILVYSFGQFILLNIFLVILLENESNNETVYDSEEEDEGEVVEEEVERGVEEYKEGKEMVVFNAAANDTKQQHIEVSKQVTDQLDRTIQSYAKGQWVRNTASVTGKENRKEEEGEGEGEGETKEENRNDDTNENKQQNLLTLPGDTNNIPRPDLLVTPEKKEQDIQGQNEEEHEIIEVVRAHSSSDIDQSVSLPMSKKSRRYSSEPTGLSYSKSFNTTGTRSLNRNSKSKHRRHSTNLVLLLSAETKQNRTFATRSHTSCSAGSPIRPNDTFIKSIGSDLPRHKSIDMLLDLRAMEDAKNEVKARKSHHDTKEQRIKLNGKACGIFAHDSTTRIFIHKMVVTKYFEYCVLSLIGASSLLLAAETPDVVPDSSLDQVLDVMNLLFTILFTIEIILKSIAFGFMYPKKTAYSRNGWNRLDFFIVIVSIFGFIVEGTGIELNVNFVKGFRAARALRPLRLIKRAPGLRRVVNTLIKSIPPMANRMLVCVLFLLIFGILGVQLFKGRLYYCAGIGSDGSENDGKYRYSMNRSECLGLVNVNVTLTAQYGSLTMMTGEASNGHRIIPNITQKFSGGGSIVYVSNSFNRTWVNHRQHFDNIGASILTLFEVTSLEMWPEIFASTVDAPLVRDDHPVYMNDIMPALYFVPVVMICSLLVANLFVAAVVETFADIMASEDGSYLVTPAQQAWADVMHIMIVDKPALPMEFRGPRWKKELGKIMEYKTTEFIIVILIASNVVTMSMYYWSPLPVDTTYTITLELFNFIFLFLFFMEAVLKIVGWSFRQYWHDSWNRFDFVIVVLTTGGWLLINSGLFNLMFASDNGGAAVQIIIMLRVSRVARVVRLAKRAEATKALLRTLLLALPAVANVAGVFLLLIYIFSIVGMHMFGKLTTDGDFFDIHANFHNVGIGMLTLFRCATGESWNGIMYDIMDRSANSASVFFAMAYFTVFQVLGSMMMLNLIVAVVLDQFGTVTTRNRMPITPVNIQQFNKAWAEVARTVYTYEEVEELMRNQLREEKKSLTKMFDNGSINRKAQKLLGGDVENGGFSNGESKRQYNYDDYSDSDDEEDQETTAKSTGTNEKQNKHHWHSKVRKLRKSLLPYLPIESLHFVLEKVPPPLGVQRKGRRNTMSTSKLNTLITNIIMNLHTNVHSTPYSSTSIESFEVLVALAARKFDEKATLLPKNAIGIRARKCRAGWTCTIVFLIDTHFDRMLFPFFFIFVTFVRHCNVNL